MDDKVTAKYKIFDTFIITGRGLVFGGQIIEGRLSIGDIIEFPLDNKLLRRKITGIEGVRSAYPDKFNTGLLVKCDSDEEINKVRNAPLQNTMTCIYNADT